MTAPWLRWNDAVQEGMQREMEETAPGKRFTKHDRGKPRFSLIPLDVLEEMIDVLEHGAEKYGEHNWIKCEDHIRYYDAAMRHLMAWMRGEEADPDTGKSHLAHALCCITFLRGLENRGR